MSDLIFHGQYIHSTDLTGVTGLSPTIDVYRTTISDGTTSQVVTAGNCTETGGGIYRYRLSDADLSLYHYVANMKTTSTDVAQKHVAALGLVVPDVLVSSRLAPTTAGRALAVAATGEAAANVTMQAGVLIPGPLALESTAQAILEDTGTTLPGLIAAVGGGAGAITFTYTLTNSDGGAPIGDADVWVTSDETGSNVVASGRTDQYGVVTFYLDAGTVYIWRQKGGWVFVNPDVEVVS